MAPARNTKIGGIRDRDVDMLANIDPTDNNNVKGKRFTPARMGELTPTA